LHWRTLVIVVNPQEPPMTYEYDFEMVKRAYAEMARRAREKDEVRRLPRNGSPSPQQQAQDAERQSIPA
jgi:hypothetical protein